MAPPLKASIRGSDGKSVPTPIEKYNSVDNGIQMYIKSIMSFRSFIHTYKNKRRNGMTIGVGSSKTNEPINARKKLPNNTRSCFGSWLMWTHKFDILVII
jgi:hypothetical protein